MSHPERPPFDAIDGKAAMAYLRHRNLMLIDPFADAQATGDMIFTTALSGARFLMAQSFGIARADGTTFRAFPFIVAKSTANAFAVERGGLQLYGLDVGLVTAAFEISLFIFSRTSLFTEIGEAGAEAAPDLPDGSQLAFWMADELRQDRPEGAQPVGLAFVPRDPQRELAVHLLTQLMLRFVWLHELYHGLNGHTGLLASRSPDAVLNEMADEAEIGFIEVEPKGATKHRKGLRHAMEYDADRSALWMLIRLQQIDLEPIAALADWPKPLRLKLALFAAVPMTFVFDQAARRQAKQSDATHPAAQHRLLDLVRTVASNLMQQLGDIRQAFTATLAEMDHLHACLPSFQASSTLLNGLRSASLQQELDEIDDALTAARAEFAPFAYRAAAS